MSDPSTEGGPDRAYDPDRHINAMAPLVGLNVTPEQRPGVSRFLAVARRMATLVAAAPLDRDTIELAPVFTPGGRKPDGA